jgi:hypothetical protein
MQEWKEKAQLDNIDFFALSRSFTKTLTDGKNVETR